MRKTVALVAILLASAFAGSAFAADSGCEAKAIDKNGKALAGAAKNAFIKKCEGAAKTDGAASACEAKAIDKNGKALAGAAKNAFMKKCSADAK